MEETVWVYIIKGENGRHYTGITNDLDRRIREHRGGQSRSTRKYGKIDIVWIQGYESREEARKIEVKIKSQGAGRWLKTYGG